MSSKIGSHPRGVSFEHTVSRFDNFSLRFGLHFFFLYLFCTNRSNSSREKNFFTPLATPRVHEIIARNVLSHCHGIIIAMLYTRPSFLARILQFKYSNVSCSYLCFPRFHIHLPSINHRPIPFIASSLYFSIFTSWVYILRFFSLLLLPAFVPPCFPV